MPDETYNFCSHHLHVSAGTKTAPRVLIASGDGALNAELVRLLGDRTASISAGARSILTDLNNHESVHLVILGETSSDSRTLDILESIKQVRPDVAVLLISAHPTVEHAAESIRRGAEDFVPVPYSEEVVRKEVARILEAAELRDRVEPPRPARRDALRIRARDQPFAVRMRPVFDRAQAAARSETPVLDRRRDRHRQGADRPRDSRATAGARSGRSCRSTAPRCRATSSRASCSVTVAARSPAPSADHPGLFVAAHGGTPVPRRDRRAAARGRRPSCCACSQDGEVRPVGGLDSRRVDVRIVAASNRTLEPRCASGGMRQDLFFRLSRARRSRSRRCAIGATTCRCSSVTSSTRLRERGMHHVSGIEPDALDLLADYPFPGNIRELENLLEGSERRASAATAA